MNSSSDDNREECDAHVIELPRGNTVALIEARAAMFQVYKVDGDTDMRVMINYVYAGITRPRPEWTSDEQQAGSSKRQKIEVQSQSQTQQTSWAHKHLPHRAHPACHIRCLEIPIKVPCDASTKSWNLGAMLLDLSAMRTFSGEAPPEEHYKLKEHLAETAEVLNPFPRTILGEGDLDIARAGFDDEGRVKNIPPRKSNPSSCRRTLRHG